MMQWALVLFEEKTKSIEIFCVTVYVALGILSLYISIQELRGFHQENLRVVVLLTIYRHALHTYDLEDKIVPNENLLFEMLDHQFTVGLCMTSILVYLVCFPPSPGGTTMCVVASIFIMVGTRMRLSKLYGGIEMTLRNLMTAWSIAIFSFALLYAENLYVHTVAKDSEKAEQ